LKTVFVVGSNSFSGSHFCDYCLSRGLQVVGVSRSPEPHNLFLPYSENKRKSQLSFHQIDINSDWKYLFDLFNNIKPEYVANFAAQGMVEESWSNPAQWYKTNFLSAVRIHDFLKDKSYLEKFVQISTPEVYGATARLVDESEQMMPTTPYAISKASADMHLYAYKERYGFPVVTTRAANVYGPGQQLYRLIPKLMLSIFSGKKFPLHGGGVVKRSFIHISDVVRGTFNAMTCAAPGSIYHFSTSEMMTVSDLVGKVCDLMGVSFENVVELSYERNKQDPSYSLDVKRANDELSWKYEVDLRQGLGSVEKWIASNYEVLSGLSTKYQHKD